MGNSGSTTTSEGAADTSNADEVGPSTMEAQTTTTTTQNNAFVTNNSLLEECREMCNASFLIYTFGYMLSVARKHGSLSGLQVDEKGRLLSTEESSSTVFSPQQVTAILKNNFGLLKNHFADHFEDPTLVMESLDQMTEMANQEEEEESSLSSPPPLTLQHFDDRHQEHEMVYAVAKNDLKKRITVVFRGTDNDLAFYTNWATNINAWKTAVAMPASLKGKVGDKEQVWIHSGFYNYLFNKTFDDSDDPNLVKFEEVMAHVEALLQENPGYKLYVTGHSLGAALATVAAFFMACRPGIPQPVSCINFASPRVGDEAFLSAIQVLEQDGAIRICRVVNDNDSIAFVPMFYYKHVGFQVRLYKGGDYPTLITYPKVNDSWYNRYSRIYENSLLASVNVHYDHSEYRERIGENDAALAKERLDDLYNNSELTGFSPSKA